MMQNDTPQITPTTPLYERVLRWMNDTALEQAFFHWYGKTRGGLQLRRRSRSLQTIPSLAFGHALGKPGNVNQQRTVLRELFSLAHVAPSSGLVVELPTGGNGRHTHHLSIGQPRARRSRRRLPEHWRRRKRRCEARIH